MIRSVVVVDVGVDVGGVSVVFGGVVEAKLVHAILVATVLCFRPVFERLSTGFRQSCDRFVIGLC